MCTSRAVPATAPRRVKIYFQDDAVRQRSQDTAKQLLASAASVDGYDTTTATTTTTSGSNSALLAKKALKYRNVYDRMTGVDVTSPNFDASTFLGVEWCHTPNLRAHCERMQ